MSSSKQKKAYDKARSSRRRKTMEEEIAHSASYTSMFSIILCVICHHLVCMKNIGNRQKQYIRRKDLEKDIFEPLGSMRGKGMENRGLNLTLSSKDRNALLKRCTRQCAQSF
jgi:hypothetical protein